MMAILAPLAVNLITRVWKAHAGGIATTVTDVTSGGQLTGRLTELLTPLIGEFAMPVAYVVNYAIGFVIPYFFPANK